MTTTIILLILLALLFDFLNGFHDSANSIATIVSTRVLSPKYAVIWAATFNFLAFFIFGSHVAKTIGKGIININIIDTQIIFATLTGAVVWNLITWFFGLPTSSSHALIGGMIGAALVKSGPSSLVLPGIIKVTAFIVIAPVIGFVLGIFLGNIVYFIFRKNSPTKVDHLFRKGQLLSAALYSLGHGGNDAQKTAGIIAGLLFSAGMLGVGINFPSWMPLGDIINKIITEGHKAGEFYVPAWVAFMCYLMIALGTMFGGWRIVKTMGQKVAKLKPVDGFAAETSAAIALYGASVLGVPVSTTHTITGSIMGVGSLKRMSAVRWGVAGTIVWAWILTIPFSAVISAVAYILARIIWKI